MNTKTQDQTGQQQAQEQPAAQLPATTARQEIGKIRGPRLPWHPIIEQKFGIDAASWKALCESLYPMAKTTDAICLALAYCKARGLDIMKKPVHIVPMWNSALNREVETVWPAITEHRITAHRTGQYAGTEATTFGPTKTETFKATVKKGKLSGKVIEKTVSFPEFAEVTVYRLVQGQKMAFPGPRCYWKEFFGMDMGLPVPNARWFRAPSQMIEKCAEAGALRKAFTEELGSEPVAEEMEGRIFDQVMEAIKGKPRPQARAAASDGAPFGNEVIDEGAPFADAGEEEEVDEEEIDGVTGEVTGGAAQAPERKAEPETTKLDRGAEWLAERLGELKTTPRETMAQKDKAVRAVLTSEKREADLLPQWETAFQARDAELGTPATIEKTPEPEKTAGAARVAEAVDPKDQAYQDWKKDQYELLKNAKMTRTVDDIQDMVLPDLREPDKEPWVQACNAKAKELLTAGKGAK